MPERRRTRDILIGAMTLAMIVILLQLAWQAGYRANVRDLSLQFSKSLGAEQKSLTGEIADITGTTFTLKAFSSTNARYTIITNGQTYFGRVVSKDKESFKDELSAYEEKIKTAKANNTLVSDSPPTPFTLEKISQNDLRLGDVVQVNTTENISDKSTLTATSVIKVTTRPSTSPPQ